MLEGFCRRAIDLEDSIASEEARGLCHAPRLNLAMRDSVRSVEAGVSSGGGG